MNQYMVLRIVTKLMIPIILLYAFYVQFHGEYSPGGGFQAGIIFAVAFVIYALIYGLEAAQKQLEPEVVHALAALGVFIFGGIGVVCLLMGGNFLEYKVLFDDRHAGETFGIIGVELGVGITVAAVSLTLFYSFAGREQD